MSLDRMAEYWVPEHVREYLRGLGFHLPLDDMESHIRAWDEWMGARGSFYDYRDVDGVGRVYEVHRRSIHPAMRVCKEWGSLLLNEKVQVVCENQGATDWLASYFAETGFMAQAQDTVVKAFGLGTGAFALWLDLDRRKVRIRHYDARMVIPLTWDEDGVTECAFVTRAFYRGKAVDQLQMHLRGGGLEWSGSSAPSPSTYPRMKQGGSAAPGSASSHGNSGEAESSQSSPSQPGASAGTFAMESEGSYRIVTVFFDAQGNQVAPEGVAPVYETGSPFPTFAIVKPAVMNTRVDMSPYGQSVFADALDVIQAVDVTFNAIVSEIDLSKMRVFLSDVLFDRERDGNKDVTIPFGRGDCTVFRKVMSTEDMIQEFAPALRTGSQVEAFRISLMMLGDLTGFGIQYFDVDESRGYVKTATEVASDNSALLRNIRRHENNLEGALRDVSRAVMAAARSMGESIPDEGGISVAFDDSIVQDVAAEKAQDMREVGVTLNPFEYRMRWYAEDEPTARARASELGAAKAGRAGGGTVAAR